MLTDNLAARLADLHARGLYRTRRLHHQVPIRQHFASNDYLGLADSPAVRMLYSGSFAQFPSGSGGSFVVNGYHPAHQAMEAAFCDALAVEDCVVFPSGYAANLAIARLFSVLDATLIIDKAVHASVYDGIAQSATRFVRFSHTDAGHMQARMKQVAGAVAVFTESVFSMSGRIAPLADYAARLAQDRIPLVVDEAHAFGILGPEGLGGIPAAGLGMREVPLRVIPLGKAFASQGAVIAGARIWIEALIQNARSGIYSTAMAPAFADALRKMLTLVRGAEERRARLEDNIRHFTASIERSPLNWADSVTPIQQLRLGCPHKALAVSQWLLDRDILCIPMREPTVSRSETGLRVLLNSAHTPADIDRFLEQVHDACG